ncbi:MAG: ABC-F family ATP-binding cassette domain-containing protein [Candidatus Krumholzibacteriota bacterium]|nr:ABC-F family ATP-binding cassette domain-containing protein [Candidatus Krumholzibacteriota bacterium]
MISINNVCKSFGAQVLFSDLSFTINRRERVGLVGRNGHGKTTLLRMIVEEESFDSGEIAIPRRYRIGHLRQHLEFTQPTVLEEASLGLPDDQMDETWRAERILAGLGFTDADMQKPPAIFSGGYQVRLNLARLIVSQPDLLLLDEPTNYLDVVSIRWLTRFLRTWPSELLLVTHDRSFMDGVVTHTVAIHRNRAKKIAGSTAKLYEQILQEEEIYEKTRANDEKKRKEIERFVARFRAKNTLATRVQSRIKYLQKHKPLDALQRIQTLDFSFRSERFPGKVMTSVKRISFAYDDGPELIAGLDLEIHKHDRICVMGQNGKGKSTLLRLLAGQLQPRAGEIVPHPRLDTGFFAQTNVDTLNPGNTVVEEIMSADRDCLPQTARDISGAMMFEQNNALKRISVLSGGEKSRVMLGKLIVAPFHMLLLDEPTNHLDMDSCDSLLAAVDAFDGAVVMVTHNEMFLHTLATRFIVFDRGQVVLYDRTYQDFLDDVGWEMDESLGAKTKRSAASAPPMGRKAARQERARLAQERERAVGPLQKRVTELEKQITRLESEAKTDLGALEAASMTGDAKAIAELSRKHGELEGTIEGLYADLETATEELDLRTVEFDGRIDKLN